MPSNKLELGSSTISEFHENLMVYYNLVKQKQSDLKGVYAEAVTTLKIP